ncbi:hypothetical protein [Streptosporangium sp. NPDC051022]|uniref:hypothetical protein n=1 Tax=Streptosporangium sp. NPDC051022 TaxID=3155752 RepID=UPI003425C2B7
MKTTAADTGRHAAPQDAPRRGGRPTKLTPQVQAGLVAALQAGHSIASAAALAGISERSVHAWRARGEDDDAPEEFLQFAQALTHARAKACEILLTAAFRDAIGGIEISHTIRPDGTETVRITPPNGRLALELLSRMSPEWRPVKAVALEVSGPQGGVVKGGLDEAALERLAARVSKAARRARAEQAARDAGANRS